MGAADRPELRRPLPRPRPRPGPLPPGLARSAAPRQPSDLPAHRRSTCSGTGRREGLERFRMTPEFQALLARLARLRPGRRQPLRATLAPRSASSGSSGSRTTRPRTTARSGAISRADARAGQPPGPDPPLGARRDPGLIIPGAELREITSKSVSLDRHAEDVRTHLRGTSSAGTFGSDGCLSVAAAGPRPADAASLERIPDMETAGSPRSSTRWGRLLEVRGENPFRCRAYHNAAQALKGLPARPLGDDRRRHAWPRCRASARRCSPRSSSSRRPATCRPTRSCGRQTPPGPGRPAAGPGPGPEEDQDAARRR